jgi:hypothetical protein
LANDGHTGVDRDESRYDVHAVKIERVVVVQFKVYTTLVKKSHQLICCRCWHFFPPPIMKREW